MEKRRKKFINSNYFFTSDEHYDHSNIIRYCNRPFSSIEEMNEELIERHNEIVTKDDIVIHGGDFTLIPKKETVYQKYVKRLNGNHIFLRGSHDRWLPKSYMMIWEKTIEKQPVTVCHYQMFKWHRSHYGSWQLYGHSHGNSIPFENQMDIGVDTNDFYPYSWEEIKNNLQK